MKKFRHPKSNHRYTKQLFYELSRDMIIEARTFEPLYTLHQDVEGYINFRREYISDRDPTGYKTASRLLENYDHWQLLMKSLWFKEAKELWDAEMSAAIEQEAMAIVRGILRDKELKPAERLSAAKILLSVHNPSKKTVQARRGRPSAEEVEGNLKADTAAEKAMQDDLERIRSIGNETIRSIT